MSEESKIVSGAVARRRLWREKVKGFKKYQKTEIVDALHGVVNIPKSKVSELFDAFCDLMVEISFEESVVMLPRFGKFVFEPKAVQKIWNPKEGKSLFYQNPKVTFRAAQRLKSSLRKTFRKNCYQLLDLNADAAPDFKAPMRQGKAKGKNSE